MFPTGDTVPVVDPIYPNSSPVGYCTRWPCSEFQLMSRCGVGARDVLREFELRSNKSGHFTSIITKTRSQQLSRCLLRWGNKLECNSYLIPDVFVVGTTANNNDDNNNKNFSTFSVPCPTIWSVLCSLNPCDIVSGPFPCRHSL